MLSDIIAISLSKSMNTELQELQELFGPIKDTPLFLIFAQINLLNIFSEAHLNPNYAEEYTEATGLPFEGINGFPTLIFDSALLARQMGLDGDERDGLKLMDRLLPGNGIKGLLSLRKKSFPAYIALTEIDRSLKDFATRAEAELTTPREELIIESLVFILDRQLVREMQICPLAANYAQLLAKYRPEYFSREALGIIEEGKVIENAYHNEEKPRGIEACLTTICSNIVNTMQR